jgi:hypothetical protein
MASAQSDVDQKPSMEDGYLGPIFDVRSRALSLSDAHILKFALEAAIHSVSRGLKPCHWQKLTITCSN